MKFKTCNIYSALFLISLEGFPPIILYSGKSLLNTHPAAIIDPFLTTRPEVNITFLPIRFFFNLCKFVKSVAKKQT